MPSLLSGTGLVSQAEPGRKTANTERQAIMGINRKENAEAEKLGHWLDMFALHRRLTSPSE